MNDMRADKLEGMLAAHAVGDALGAPHEFRVSKYKYTGIVQYPALLKTQYQGTKKSAVGQVTDDTEMTMALADSIIKNNGYVEKDVVLAYEEWANSKPFGMGRNTRALFAGVKTYNGYTSRWKKIFGKTDPSEWSQSNGSLMRCSPLVIFVGSAETSTTGEDKFYLKDTILSNPHTINIDATNTYLGVLSEMLDYVGGPLDVRDTLETSSTKACTKEVKGIIRKVLNDVEVDVSINRGWVLHALYMSLKCLKLYFETESSIGDVYRECIVPKNGQGLPDTDTNAAISGALIGAALGISKLNLDPTFSGNYLKIWECDTLEGDSPRPAKYSPSRIPELAAGLADVMNT